MGQEPNKASKKMKVATAAIALSAMAVVLVTSFFMPMYMSRNTDPLSQREDLEEAVLIQKVYNWESRVYNFPSRFGRIFRNVNGNGYYYEQKWLFEDSEEEFNDLYCVQPGESHSHAYEVYDLYDKYYSDNQFASTYFASEDNFKHFMWILEHMYTTNVQELPTMEENLLKELEKYDGHVREYYEGMDNEIEEQLKICETFNAEDAKYGYRTKVGEDKDVWLPLYVTNDPYNARPSWYKWGAADEYSIKQKYLFIKVLQTHILLQYVNQRTDYAGSSVFDANDHLYPLYGFVDNASTYNYYGQEFSTDTYTRKFSIVLAKYLVNGYDSKTYDVHKYKDFYNTLLNGTNANYDGWVNVDGDSATYNPQTKMMGPIKIKNKYGFQVEKQEVLYNPGSTEDTEVSVQGYEIVDKDGNPFDLSSATGDEEKEFYVKITEDIPANMNLEATFLADYGEAPKSTVFVPPYDPEEYGWEPQLLVNVERVHYQNGYSVKVTPDKTPDIALKKYICKVNDDKIQNPRLGSINTERLDNGDSVHTAKYNMNKTPVEVNVGDTVLYRIQMFNEGDVEGKASKIRDYLPKGLSFVKAYYGKDEDNLTEITEGITKSGNNEDIIEIVNPYLDLMQPHQTGENGDKLKENSQSIYVECKVTNAYDGVYTNVAEITGYQIDGGIDIDSSGINWVTGAATKNGNGIITAINTDSDEWKDYSNNQDEHVGNNDFYDFEGQEDDDDFDKIVVKRLDLALTKKIDTRFKDGKEEKLHSDDGQAKDKEDITGYSEVKENSKKIKGQDLTHTLTYTMNKKLANVDIGDIIVSTISVYNEGDTDGFVEEVTDYMPDGLEYDAEKTKELNKDNDPGITISEGANGVLTVKFNEPKTLSSLTSFTEDNMVDKVTFKIAMRVGEDARGKLINSAAITKYGYKNPYNNEITYAGKGSKNSEDDESNEGDEVDIDSVRTCA